MVDSVAAALDSIVVHRRETVCRRSPADAPEITARFCDPGGNIIGL
jgi:hypothetical protein